ncbi:GxxExxY protein [bacterium]|nr:GxxExxY protein [bacterium]MBU3929535.1 GxxExxY protein [bacterium]
MDNKEYDIETATDNSEKINEITRIARSVCNEYKTGFIIDSHMAVEVRSLKEMIPASEGQLKSYLKKNNLKTGLILNFGSNKLEFKQLTA